MVQKTNSAIESRFDGFKWLAVTLVVAAGVVGNWYFSELPLLYRVVALLALAAMAGFVALQTAKGKSFSRLLKDVRIEIRKVVWPTRQETTQTTLQVVVVVLLMGLILWLLDYLLGWLVKSLIG
jgi:preprotein translocase subunit SecE